LTDPGESLSLLSAPDSSFDHIDPIVVTKGSTQQSVDLRNATSIQLVKQWIVGQRGYYNPASTYAPRDFQTVLLRAPHRFHPTGKVERGFSRSIFEETARGRLYYVDEGHPGHSAHLEVFSANREHLGTADILNGTLNATNRVAGRRLKL